MLDVEEIARRIAGRAVAGDPDFKPSDIHDVEATSWEDVRHAVIVELVLALLEERDD